MMTMAHPSSGMEGPPAPLNPHHPPPSPHHMPPHARSWYMDPSGAARYSAAAAAAAAADPHAAAAAAHLGLQSDHHLGQSNGIVGSESVGSGCGSGAASGFFSQEASRYYQMHQAYESAASQGIVHKFFSVAVAAVRLQ